MAKTGKHDMVRAAAAAAALAMASQIDSPEDESSLSNESRAMATAKKGKGKHNMVRAAAAAASMAIAIAAQAESPSDESTVHKARPTPRWTPEEIERLRRLVPDEQPSNWNFIASKFPGRTAKQCRERWSSQHSMGTERKLGPWTTEEDRILFDYQRKFGNKWAKISVMLPGRTDNDVKNRWWSQERTRKRAGNRAAGGDAPPKKKRAAQRKSTSCSTKCALTPMKSPALNDVTSMNSTEFVEKELELPALPAMDACPLSSLSDDQLFDIVAPPIINVGTCPSSIMSVLESDAASFAASSLIALKSGLTPADKDDITFKDEHAAPQVCLQSSVKWNVPTPKWSYPRPNSSFNKENIAPQAPSTHLKMWTYPPPAQCDQARAAKASEIFSPSYKLTTNEEGNSITPPSTALQLDTLPLCDSGPFITRTPMPDAQVNRACHQVVTMSKIKPSPIVPKNRCGEPTNLFSPLPFYDTPANDCEPGLFVQTANMLGSGLKNNVAVYPSAPLPNSRLPYPSHVPDAAMYFPTADV